MEENQLAGVEERLDKLIRLTAYGLVAGQSQKQQVRVLTDAGLRSFEIAEILGLKTNQVTAVLSSLRKDVTKKGVRSARQGK